MLAWESLAFHPPIGAGTEVVLAENFLGTAMINYRSQYQECLPIQSIQHLVVERMTM
jgi:hypothetical protein